jgi:hypothetical protein
LEPSSSAGLKERKKRADWKKATGKELGENGENTKKKRRTYPEETGIRFCL